MFIGASLIPDYYANKVDLFVALAPIVRLDHSSNGLIVAASGMVDYLSSSV